MNFKYKQLLICYFILHSCSSFYAGLKHVNIKSEENIFFVKNDVNFPLQKTILFDHYKTINPDPKIIDNKFLYFTRNGKIISFDLLKNQEKDSHKFKYGSNVGVVYFEKYALFSFGAGENNLLLYNLVDAKTVWTKTILFGIESQPIFDNSGIYVASMNGTIYKYNWKTSDEVWTVKTTKAIHANITKLNKTIVASNDAGETYRIQKNDGKILWKNQTYKVAIYSKGLPLSKSLMLANIQGDLFFLSLDDGKLLSQERYSAPFYANPSKDEENIYIGNNNGNLYKLDFKGNEIWAFEASELISSQVLLGLKYVYFGSGSGQFYILNKETKEIKFEDKFKGRFISAPLLWRKKLIIFSDNDDTYIFSSPEKNQFN